MKFINWEQTLAYPCQAWYNLDLWGRDEHHRIDTPSTLTCNVCQTISNDQCWQLSSWPDGWRYEHELCHYFNSYIELSQVGSTKH